MVQSCRGHFWLSSQKDTIPISSLHNVSNQHVAVLVKVLCPCRVTTWLWCELPFIEYLVVELDYGKMSATNLSSFDIAL